jgi:succinoglycan biosynthesis transport protein ExoP
MLKARIWFVLVCSSLGLFGALLWVHFQPPVYEATATLRIDPSRAGSFGLSDLVANPSADESDVVHTAVALLKSDGVAIQTLNSLSDSDFQQFAHLNKPRLHIDSDSEVLTPEEENLIAQIQANTTVSQVEGTQLLQVKFRNRSPEVAASIANQLVAAYELENFTSRSRSVSQLQTWLGTQMDALRKQVDSSQGKLAAFQQANQIIPTVDNRNSITDRLGLLNEKLTEAQANRIDKEAQMRAAITGDPATLASLFPNPRLQALQTEQGTLYGQYAQLATKFGPKYAPLAEMKKQMQLIDGEIGNSVESIRDELKQQYNAAFKTQSMLQDQYNQQTKLAYALNRNQAEYAELQAEVTSSRELYETLEHKLQQAAVDTQVNAVDTVVVDHARSPVFPIAPKKVITVLSGLVIGLFSGLVVAFVFESSSGLVRTPEQVEKVTGYTSLATIPRERSKDVARIGNGSITDTTSGLITMDNPASQGAEAYRVLRNALLSSRGSGVKTILFTSTLSRVDLTSVVANFAVSLAQTGASVLVVDADLRNPGMHKRFGAEDGVGLGDYLSGESAVPAVKRPLKQLPNLSLLTSGERPALPSESLASDNLRSLPEKLDSSYDYIIVKSAPLLLVSDALPLANWADSTVLVAQYGETGTSELSAARKLLKQSRARIAGVVLLGAPASSGLYSGRIPNQREYYA